jgi:hypothetical protein
MCALYFSHAIFINNLCVFYAYLFCCFLMSLARFSAFQHKRQPFLICLVCVAFNVNNIHEDGRWRDESGLLWLRVDTCVSFKQLMYKRRNKCSQNLLIINYLNVVNLNADSFELSYFCHHWIEMKICVETDIRTPHIKSWDISTIYMISAIFLHRTKSSVYEKSSS